MQLYPAYWLRFVVREWQASERLVLVGPSTAVFAADNGASDAALRSAVKDRLKGKNFKDVTVRVQDGTATLVHRWDLVCV